MKYGLIIIIVIFNGCVNPKEIVNPKSCLQKIDSIGTSQTFREAIAPAEICVALYENDTRLNLILAELYLLSHLVDSDDNGLKKATDQFSKVLTIDTSFVTNNSEFNLGTVHLSELSEIWFAIQEDIYEQERERILIWALIEDFDSEKEPKLIK